MLSSQNYLRGLDLKLNHGETERFFILCKGKELIVSHKYIVNYYLYNHIIFIYVNLAICVGML